MNIVGWNNITPQLAAFFAVLKRLPALSGTPFNLFVSGYPGTNKTEGMVELARYLDLTAALVDSSTLDDVSELAGQIDLRANREDGESRLIEGDLLKRQVLVLDEFLNVRPHVLPQFRLMLQGKLVLMAKEVEMSVRSIIGTGNLGAEMLEGDANVLDSPTADRFAMVVTVPRLHEMSLSEQKAILAGDEDSSFADSFRQAYEAIDAIYDAVESESGQKVTSYVLSLSRQLSDSPFAFEGRRAKLVRRFVIATLALCKAEAHRDQNETLYEVVRDCLSYHQLSGVDLDYVLLRMAHQEALLAMNGTLLESTIAEAPSLAEKIAIVVENLDAVTPDTKALVFGQVLDCDDIPLQLACTKLVHMPRFDGQPAELIAMIDRIAYPFPAGGVRFEQLAEMSGASQVELIAFEIANGSREETAKLMSGVHAYLNQWGVDQTL